MFKFEFPKTIIGALCVATLLLTTPLQAATLNSLDGKPLTLGEYITEGKWLVVMLWASDCDVCNEEAQS